MPSLMKICAAAGIWAVAAVPAPAEAREAGLPFWGKGNLEVYQDGERLGCVGSYGNFNKHDRCGKFFTEWLDDGIVHITSAGPWPDEGCQFSYGDEQMPPRFICQEDFPPAALTTQGDRLVNPRTNETTVWLYREGAPAKDLIFQAPYRASDSEEITIHWKSLNGTTSS